jgi:hypothetical protein
MNATELKSIKAIDLLASIGIFPEKIIKNQAWIKPPYRKHENSASMKIDLNVNLWFDHSLGKGGNTCDLAMLIFNCNLSEALKKVAILNFRNTTSIRSPLMSKVEEKTNGSIEILTIDTINDIKLCSYIVNTRQVDLHEVRRFAKELIYQSRNASYKAIGIPTAKNGWETITISGFKTSTTPKSVSWFKWDKPELAVFEGMFDAFSLRKHQKELADSCDYIIMNSLSLKDEAIDIIINSQYSKIHLFLDTDEPADIVTSGIMGLSLNIGMVINHQQEYSESKDLNDHIRGIKTTKIIQRPKIINKPNNPIIDNDDDMEEEQGFSSGISL